MNIFRFLALFITLVLLGAGLPGAIHVQGHAGGKWLTDSTVDEIGAGEQAAFGASIGLELIEVAPRLKLGLAGSYLFGRDDVNETGEYLRTNEAAAGAKLWLYNPNGDGAMTFEAGPAVVYGKARDRWGRRLSDENAGAYAQLGFMAYLRKSTAVGLHCRYTYSGDMSPDELDGDEFDLSGFSLLFSVGYRWGGR